MKSWKKTVLAMICGLVATTTIGGLVACDGANTNGGTGTESTAEAKQLGAPVVAINYGVAKWDAVKGASGYAYKINGGQEQTTSNTSIALQVGQTIQVKALGDGVSYTDSVWSWEAKYTLDRLDAPEVSVDGTTVSWNAVPNAKGYAFRINGGEEKTTEALSVTIKGGGKVEVKALGDGVERTDSKWSDPVECQSPIKVDVKLNISSAGTVTGEGAYEEGDNATLVATANDGFIFVGWYKDEKLVSDDAQYTFRVEESLSLTATFRYADCSVALTKNYDNAGTVTGAGTYEYGETVTVVATTTDDGYEFVGWYNGDQILTPQSTCTFSIEQPMTLQARWEKKTYSVSVASELGGRVTGSGQYEYGDTVTVSATTNVGYTFDGWYENGNKVSSNKDYVFTLTGDKTLTARWTKNKYTVDLSVGTTGVGTVNGAGTYEYGDTVTVVATTTNDDYSFDGWYENGTKVSDAESYEFTLTGQKTLSAKWTKDKYMISLSVGTAGAGTVEGAGKYKIGQQATVKAIANFGYTFDGWYENGTKVATTETYTFTVSGEKTLTAKWTTNGYRVTAKAGTTGAGSVSGEGAYDYGTQATLKAVSNEGYRFLGWYENNVVVSTDATYTFTVEGDRDLTAKWEKKQYTLTLNKNIDAAGTVEGAGTYEHGETGTIKATTNTGYTFLGWYDANDKLLTDDSSYSIEPLTGNRTLTAKWEANTRTITLASDFDIAGKLSGGGEHVYRSQATLTATPGTNYTFLGWYEGDTLLSTATTYTYEVIEDVTITAHWQDDWKSIEGYAYWTFDQLGNDVMPIVGFNSPNAATAEMSADVAAAYGSIPSQITDANYKMLKDSGVNTVVGWWNDWTNSRLQDDILQELDLAEKHNIVYIVSNRNSLYAKSASDLSAYKSYMDKPAYGGTILIDEPGAVNFADVASATRAWESSKYKNTLAYVNMLPNYAANWQLVDCQGTGGSYEGSFTNYETWVKLYLDTVKPQVFSYDHYPYLFTQPNFFRDGWYTNLSNVRYYTAKAGVPYWVYGQLGGWPEYGQVIDSNTKHLTYGHTALQFNSMLSYGAKGIEYYNYFMPPNYINAGNYTSATMVDGTPTPYYAQIQKINKQVAAIDDVLLRCAWKGIIQINDTPAPISSGDKVSSYGALTSATGTGNAIVGCFEYRDIGYAYYVTTNDVYNASTVTLNFNGSYNLRKVQDATESYTSGNKITLSIPAGEGVLVVVPKN